MASAWNIVIVVQLVVGLGGRQVLGHRLGKMNGERGMDPPKITFLMDRKPWTIFGEPAPEDSHQGLGGPQDRMYFSSREDDDKCSYFLLRCLRNWDNTVF